MKTNEEIQQEAQRMIVLARSYREDQRAPSLRASVVPLPRVLARLPDSSTTARHDAATGSESGYFHRHQRHIELTIDQGDLVYRLMEQETETTRSGGVLREHAPAVVMVSDLAFEVLLAGYELVEEDRLGEQLAPYAERSESSDGSDPADERSVSEVEEILETNLLSPSDRLRAKAEIVEFLEGRLEASAFIAQAIDRQSARESRHETQAERHEMRLTIDES